ncbi:MAG TPA: hypothetical protein VG387_10560 [Rhizomicrobium sp.]|nr:hypothetical protein [Rhizomicrobium sp.]
MGITEDEKFFADLWMRQGELVWWAMGLIPTIEAAVLAAWYVLHKEESPDLAICVALIGIVVMACTWIILIARSAMSRTSTCRSAGYCPAAGPEPFAPVSFGLGATFLSCCRCSASWSTCS